MRSTPSTMNLRPFSPLSARRGKSETLLLAAIAVIVVIGLAGVGLVWLLRARPRNPQPEPPRVEQATPPDPAAAPGGMRGDAPATPAAPVVPDSGRVMPAVAAPNLDQPIARRDPTEVIREQLGQLATDPADPDARTAAAWWAPLPENLLAGLPADWRAQLEAGQWRPEGEPRLLVQGGRRQRWALPLVNAGGEAGELWLDYTLERDGAGAAWQLSALSAADPATRADAVAVARRFLDALRGLDIEGARALVEPGAVGNTKLAALCILLEDELFELDEESLQQTFNRPDAQAFSATLDPVAPADRGVKPTQLGFILHRASAAGGDVWRVVELDFDEALTSFAANTGAEDAYYTPLVENPQGGQSLALYFAFDDAELNERAVSQLAIVGRLLNEDPGRRLVISGHTDSRGTEEYNEELGLQRASDVRDFLVRRGIPAAQIELRSFGASRPRARNVTTSGEDSPDGRQANRRAEIYLDF